MCDGGYPNEGGRPGRSEPGRSEPGRSEPGRREPSRRELLAAAGLGAAGLGVAGPVVTGLAGCSADGEGQAAATPRATVTSFPAPQSVTLQATAGARGEYLYLPFDVGPGVNRVDVEVVRGDQDAKIGAGLFDHRGPAYGSPGFRGVYGDERSSFFVAADSASQSFLPGPVEPGRWTVVVPVFAVPGPTEITATVTLTGGPAPAANAAGEKVGTVLDGPGWYRGDLHCHTPESSDAWSSGTALSPADWARTCREIGLDFVAMTDHNVVSQNLHLARDAGADVLLMPGEEMTNWFHGHATVSGIDVGDWLDFRQAPEGSALPEYGARIEDFLTTARDLGAYVSVAHPSAGSLSWGFGASMERPAGRTDGYEVWTGAFQGDDENSVTTWDGMLRRGWRVWANGGSDLHGTDNQLGFRAGTPTTVVYARALSTEAVVEALRAGRSFVTRRPDGVECYLTATRPGQQAYVGGSVYGGVGDQVDVRVRVRLGGGYRCVVLTSAGAVATTVLTSDDQTVEIPVPVPDGGGYVRVEVRGRERLSGTNPFATEGDMECLTNPIWLVVGDPPADARAETAPPPDQPGPRRAAPTAG